MFGSVNENHYEIVAQKDEDVNEKDSQTHDEFVFDKMKITRNVINQDGQNGFEDSGKDDEVRNEE